MALITGAIYGDPTVESNVKALWFESISSGTSGTLTPPTQGEIVLDQWSAGIDALASQISSGIPTFESPLTAGGVIITATLDALGAWTISGTPSAYPVAIVFCYKVKLRYFDYTKQLGGYELIPTAEGVYTDVTAFDGILASTDSTVQKALEKLDNGAEPALTKGNLTGTSPVTLSATRQVIGGAAAISLVNDAAGTITEVDTGALADSDTVIPTSKRAKDYADLKLAKASNLSDVAAQQTALNNLTAVAGATNEHVLTKDTDTGNAIFKVASGGVTATSNLTDNALVRGDGGAKGVQTTNIIVYDNGIIDIPSQSSCSVYMGTDQDVAATTFTTMAFDTELYDIQGEFNTSTYYFTAQKAGTYLSILTFLMKETITDSKHMQIRLDKNNVNIAYNVIYVPGTVSPVGQLVFPISLDANDTLRARTYHDYTEARQMSGALCFFTIIKLS
jgi:hypothetical protein